MCRLFGMSGGDQRVRATFWLLEAPDSLAEQSRREPDGTGLGWFDDDRRAWVAKQPLAAYEDLLFAHEARERESRVFIAHILSPPRRRAVVQGLDRLERELGDDLALVEGETDSERLFALVTRETERHRGDVGAGIAAAARWVAEHLPLYSLNLLLGTADGLWALRYPDTHELWVLERGAGGTHGARHLDAASAAGTVRVRSERLARQPAVIVASEPMDEDPGWRRLASGELLHVGPRLEVTSTIAVDRPPSHPLTLDDLEPHAAAAQTPPPPSG